MSKNGCQFLVAHTKFKYTLLVLSLQPRRYDMNGRSQILGSKNWILPKEINANPVFLKGAQA
jgi:hypothetical protein